MVEFQAPRTDTEATIASIWRDVLGFKKIGINDDFFDLGGHPLLGTLIISRVNAAFLKDFSLNQMMENPTIANMTKAVACTGEPQVHVQTEARK